MISVSDLMKRVGVGGRLVAFFKTVCVYFLLGGGGEASAGAVAAKCAPVLCLLLIVCAHRAAAPPPLTPRDEARRRYAALVGAGLALSAAGDALLALQPRLEPGMAAFAAAHVCYLAAFGWTRRRALFAVPLYLATAWYLTVVSVAGPLRVLVPLYALLLATAAWRGAARGGAAACGALLFLVSDAALGYHMFVQPLEHSKVIVMSTYYLGQLGIAYSALEPHPRPASD